MPLRLPKETIRFYLFETIIIVGMASIPLFFNFPYRVNIFLSWEGAYRIYSGQLPFKDFGLPMGYIYWIVPAIFFKIFGPYLITLVKAQVFLNILSGLAFRSIVFSLNVKDGIRTAAVIVFCLSFSFFNFWPWYNHSVIVYELISLAFMFKYLFPAHKGKGAIIFIYLSSFFASLTFFTKQDAGALTFMIIVLIIFTDFIYQRKFKLLVHFFIGYTVTSLIIVLPLLPYGFGYWFNYGQEPHNSRLDMINLLALIFGHSNWIKFYFFIIFLLVLNDIKEFNLIKDYKNAIFYTLTIGILIEAIIFQVTSYIPLNNNIFFHSFAITLILARLPINVNYSKRKTLVPLIILIFLWWSGSYWKYIKRMIDRFAPEITKVDDNKVSVSTYRKNLIDSSYMYPKSFKWELYEEPAFKRIYLPEPTIKGIKRLRNSSFFVDNDNPKVLNMTELTPLALVLNYELEKGMPLWYHVGVGIFDQEISYIGDRILNGYYDLVLFQEIPNLNNFFPEELNSLLKKNYVELDSFLAPRRLPNSTIKVYVKNINEWKE